MLNKLAGLLQGEKSNHPLGSIANLDRTLSEIPVSDASRLLLDVAVLLEEPARYDTELSPAALRQAVLHIDTFARPAYAELLLAYLLPGRWHTSEIAWSTLDRHNQLLFNAYAHCLTIALNGKEDLSKAKMQLALCSTRAMHAWVERKKLLHFRYRPPDIEWWLEAHKLVGLASQHNVMGLVQPIYPDDPQPRSTIHAYLAGLYLELAPLSNLVSVQTEVLHRWLQQHAQTFEFAEAAHEGTTHFISLHNPGNPTRYTPSVIHTPAMRYCSTRRLRAPLLQLAQNLRNNTLPEWLLPLAEQRTSIERLLHALLRHWADERPPERTSPRQSENNVMRVVHGFALARRMIACSAFAKRGKSLNYRGADMESLFNEVRFGRGNTLTSFNEIEPQIDPMETLLKLETSGDKQMMEEWLSVDVSATGVGAAAPGLRSRNRIGELVGFRFDGNIDWRIGIIRRIGRDKQKRISIGIENLPAPSVCAQVRPNNVELTVWNEASEAGNGYVDAILLAADSDTLLLIPGLFVADLSLNLIIDGKRLDIILTEKLDHGQDWERVRFRPATEEPQ